jgi:DNA-binding NtrC family response regulator
MTARILLVDDDLVFRESAAELLRQDGYELVTAADGAAAAEVLARGRFDLLVLDLRMPGLDGITLTEVLRRRGERLPVLMVSGFGTVDAAVRALHQGADDFLTKPVEPAMLSERVRRLIERRPASTGPSAETAGATGRIIGRSVGMDAVRSAIRAVAATEATVLITGETGTGKELVARAIHDASRRARGPFVAANCAALAAGVIESELFGHVRGAFTGAVQDRPGLFRAAHGGTIFLDEIGDMGGEAQHRLLRVLQEREVLPVGSVRAVKVDARVMAATNRDLRSAISHGAFREDLFYRLNVFPIHLPPLRERREDIPLLAESILAGLSRRRGGASLSLGPFALRLLASYSWPGNVRELVSALESAVIRAEGGTRIDAHHLPDEVRSPAGDGLDRYRAAPSDDERQAIEAALKAAGGVRARAAVLLGMGRTTLWRKMREYGLA